METNLGMRSTLASLRPVQEAFLMSAATLVKSSPEILPAQYASTAFFTSRFAPEKKGEG